MKIEKLSPILNRKTLQLPSKQVFISVIFIILYVGNHKIKMHTKNITNQIHPSFSQKQFQVILSYCYEDITYVARFIQYLINISNIQKFYYKQYIS